MDTKAQTQVPKHIQNSLYVHPFLDDTEALPKAFLEKLSEKQGFLRLSPRHSNLSLVTKQGEKTQKISVIVNNQTINSIHFTSIFLYPNNTALSPNLHEFSQKHTLVLTLNLVKEIELTRQEKEILHTEKRTLTNILTKINEKNLFNDKDFYQKYITKHDKITFPKIFGIEDLLDKKFFLITFDNQTTALISANQLFATLVYSPTPQKTKHEKPEFASQSPINIRGGKPKPKQEDNPMSESMSQAFLSSPKHKADTDSEKSGSEVKTLSQMSQTFFSPPKRKAQTDLNQLSKRTKIEEENKTTAETNNLSEKPILEDSNSLNF